MGLGGDEGLLGLEILQRRGVRRVVGHVDAHGHEIDLAFGEKDGAAAVAEAGVGPVQDEQIGKVPCGHAEIGPRIVVAPDVADGDAAAPGDFHRP